MRKIDLHTHSSASDGSDAPALLVRNAENAGLAAIALTDHDTVSGLDEFLATPISGDLLRIPGVELSSILFNKELHIVGLFLDRSNEKLTRELSAMRDGRLVRNQEIVTRLNTLGYRLSYEEVEEFAKGESIGRPHIAALLIRKGYFETSQDVFDQCLKRGAPAYFPRTLPTSQEAVELIHEAGGLAIWAHPVSGHQDGTGQGYVRKMLKKLVDFGLDGVETRYSMFTEAQESMMDRLADEFHLLHSGGSDYHGSNQPMISLGNGQGNLVVPESFLEPLRNAAKQREKKA